MTWDAEHLPQSLRLDRLALRAGGTAHGRLLVSELTLHAAPGDRWIGLARAHLASAAAERAAADARITKPRKAP